MNGFYEDLELGAEFESPRQVVMSKAAIVDFANSWDPQLYHVDEEAAAQSPVGEIFASAFHSMAVAQKLAHEAGAFDVLPVVGLGISDIRLAQAVVAGDSVRARVTVTGMRESRSKPDQGVVNLRVDLINQRDEVALTYTLSELVRRRPHDEPSGSAPGVTSG